MAVGIATWTTLANASNLTTQTTTSNTLPTDALLVVAMACTTSLSAGATISDSAGGSWTSITSGGVNPGHRLWSRTTPGNGGAFTVSVTFASATSITLIA